MEGNRSGPVKTTPGHGSYPPGTGTPRLTISHDAPMTKPRGRRRGQPPDASQALYGVRRTGNGTARPRPAPPTPPALLTPPGPPATPGRSPYGHALPRAAYPAYARSVYPAPAPRGQPRIPKGTGDMRRYLAVGLDSYLCLLAVGLLVRSCLDSGGTGRAVALLVVQSVALSFANQVLLTMAVRASAGKLIMGVRVIRLPDAGGRDSACWCCAGCTGSSGCRASRGAGSAAGLRPVARRGPRATAPRRPRSSRGCARSGAVTCGPTGRRYRGVRAEPAPWRTRAGRTASVSASRR